MKLYSYFEFDHRVPDAAEYSRKLDDHNTLEAKFYALTKYWETEDCTCRYDEEKHRFVITMPMATYRKYELDQPMPGSFEGVPVRFEIK